MNKSLYKTDGVDVDAGEELSEYAGRLNRSTWTNTIAVDVASASSHFRTEPGYDMKPHLRRRRCTWTGGADGIGTKVGIHDAALAHDTAAFDLVAMVADDRARRGDLPAVLLSVLDLRTTEPIGLIKELYDGAATAAKQLRVPILSGETAELGGFVGSENPNPNCAFNWAGVMVAVRHEKKYISGKDIKPGDVVYACKEKGFRSNGISSVRKAFRMRFGDEWWNVPEAQPFIKQAATPAKIYSPFLAKLNGWYHERLKTEVPLKAIAHITGGGIVGKFGNDILRPLGLSAELDNLFYPAPIMQNCIAWRGMKEEEACRTFNYGQGCLTVMHPSNASSFEEIAGAYGIEVRRCGLILRHRKPQLSIVSRLSKRVLEYPMG